MKHCWQSSVITISAVHITEYQSQNRAASPLYTMPEKSST